MFLFGKTEISNGPFGDSGPHLAAPAVGTRQPLAVAACCAAHRLPARFKFALNGLSASK